MKRFSTSSNLLITAGGLITALGVFVADEFGSSAFFILGGTIVSIAGGLRASYQSSSFEQQVITANLELAEANKRISLSTERTRRSSEGTGIPYFSISKLSSRGLSLRIGCFGGRMYDVTIGIFKSDDVLNLAVNRGGTVIQQFQSNVIDEMNPATVHIDPSKVRCYFDTSESTSFYLNIEVRARNGTFVLEHVLVKPEDSSDFDFNRCIVASRCFKEEFSADCGSKLVLLSDSVQAPGEIGPARIKEVSPNLFWDDSNMIHARDWDAISNSA